MLKALMFSSAGWSMRHWRVYIFEIPGEDIITPLGFEGLVNYRDAEKTQLHSGGKPETHTLWKSVGYQWMRYAEKATVQERYHGRMSLF